MNTTTTTIRQHNNNNTHYKKNSHHHSENNTSLIDEWFHRVPGKDLGLHCPLLWSTQSRLHSDRWQWHHNQC